MKLFHIEFESVFSSRWYYVSHVLAGALAALWTPPLYWWFMLPIGFGWLYVSLTHPLNVRSAFRTGWCWGIGYFLTSLSWMVVPLWQFVDLYGWLIPFEIIFIHGGLALFVAMSSYVFKRFQSTHSLLNALLFVVCYMAGEWLRGHILTGFPWAMVGYVWAMSDRLIQIAGVLNIYVLCFLTVLMAISPFIWRSPMLRLTACLASVFVICFVFFIGSQRLKLQETVSTNYAVRLVQANIPQTLKWDPKFLETILRMHVGLSKRPGFEKVNVFIWPETAFPYQMDESGQWAEQLSSVLLPHQYLITGAIRSEKDSNEQRLYNSIAIINAKGDVSFYDKHHLVPFGEYVPLREILPLDKITVGDLDFSAGAEPYAIDVAGLPPLLPLICYEVIFPDYAGNDDKAQWMLNVTNDAWFGHSFQPYQHLDMARFRAVEQGLPMVRSANTGISAVIDSYGRLTSLLGYNQAGVLDALLPAPIIRSVIGE